MAESHTVNDGSSSARKRRGRSSLKDLIQRHKDAGTKEPITLKGDGTIEGSVSTSFRSYLGIVVRLRCPISHRTWKSVPAEHKDMVWEDVTELFDVPQNDLTRKFKKQEMRGAGTMWRNFKSDLANKYIFERKHGGDPTIMYPFITPDQWTSFVEQRMTNEAQELRARNIDKAKSNQYQHTLSRGGYKKAREELIAEKKAQMEEQGLISAEEEPLVQIERHEVWKRGHQRRNREYVNDSMRMVAEKIDELQELASQGQVTPRGRRDILTEATGKDEYPGRTRGVGSLVGWTTVFGKKSSSCSTCSAVTSHAPTLQSHHSGSDPCPFTDITESGKKCILHVHGDSESGTEIVTLGKVMPGRVVQYQELDDDKVKVIIDEAIKPSAELPQRFGYMETVSDAVHAFVGWPKCLVDVDEKFRG